MSLDRIKTPVRETELEARCQEFGLVSVLLAWTAMYPGSSAREYPEPNLNPERSQECLGSLFP